MGKRTLFVVFVIFICPGLVWAQESLQTAQARCVDASLEPVVRGITALLQGQVAQASAALVQVPAVPAFPELQALYTATWLWGHTQQGTLEQALGEGTSTASLPWQMPVTLALALETLLDGQASAGLVSFDATGKTPHGWGLTPAGRQTDVGPGPQAVAVSPDGRMVVVAGRRSPHSVGGSREFGRNGVTPDVWGSGDGLDKAAQ
jgi:hypothetical protein